MIKHNLTIIQGETFIKDVSFKIDKEYYSLVGYTAKSQIRPYIGSKELTDEFTCTIDSLKGIVHMQLSSAQTSEIPSGIYYYDLLLTKDGINTYYMGGKVFVEKHVTEPNNE